MTPGGIPWPGCSIGLYFVDIHGEFRFWAECLCREVRTASPAVLGGQYLGIARSQGLENSDWAALCCGYNRAVCKVIPCSWSVRPSRELSPVCCSMPPSCLCIWEVKQCLGLVGVWFFFFFL